MWTDRTGCAPGILILTVWMVVVVPFGAAQEPMSTRAPKADVANRIAQLDGPAHEVRLRALRELATCGAAARPALDSLIRIAASNEEATELRTAALHAIAAIGNPANEVVEQLLKLRDQASKEIVAAATRALEAMVPADAWRIEGEAVKELVADLMMALQPLLSSRVKQQLRLRDTTTEEMWYRFGVQVFVRESCLNSTFLIRNGEIMPLGERRFGSAPEQFVLADLDGDDTPEIYYTCSMGSGILRWSVSVVVWRGGAFECFCMPQMFRMRRLFIRKRSDRELEVIGRWRNVSWRPSLGKVIDNSARSGLQPLMIFADDLDEQQRKEFIWTLPELE